MSTPNAQIMLADWIEVNGESHFNLEFGIGKEKRSEQIAMIIYALRCLPSDIIAERDELQQTFDLQWKADQRAIKRWQEAHPGNDLVWPDRADMVVWLMEKLDESRSIQNLDK